MKREKACHPQNINCGGQAYFYLFNFAKCTANS